MGPHMGSRSKQLRKNIIQVSAWLHAGSWALLILACPSKFLQPGSAVDAEENFGHVWLLAQAGGRIHACHLHVGDCSKWNATASPEWCHRALGCHCNA